jgi:hypothetical protein
MFLGLRLVIDDLATSRRTADKDRLDTLQDVVHACEVFLTTHAPQRFSRKPLSSVYGLSTRPLTDRPSPPFGLLSRSP